MKLLLVDDDPIFRLGFQTALAQATDWEIRVESFGTVLGQGFTGSFDVILCDPYWQGDRLWLRYQDLQRRFPNVPIILFTSQLDGERLAQAKQDGIQGYVPKGMAIAELIQALEKIRAGEKAWTKRWRSINQNILAGMRRRGLNDIYTTLDLVDAYLQQDNLSPLVRWVYQGRRRELKAAAWLLRKLLPQTSIFLDEINTLPSPAPIVKAQPRMPVEPVVISTKNTRWQTLLEQTFIKLNQSLYNGTDFTLEIDILPIEKRQELCYVILQQLTQIFNDPQWQNLDAAEFKERQQRSLRNLWKLSTQEFIGRYNVDQDTQSDQFLEQLNRGAIAADAELLQHLPYLLDFYAYLLKDAPILIDNVFYRPEAKEATERAQLILENLMLKTANSIMEFVLNTFTELEIFKYKLYNPKIRSSREIARFRNDLSWQYRRQKYWFDPKSIFESQYQLLALNPLGIAQINIDAPRQEELANLQGIPWLVTMALEFRDAVAPRIRALVAWLGKIVVYFLTNVVGRAIGLIARGISEGVGNSWNSLKEKP